MSSSAPPSIPIEGAHAFYSLSSQGGSSRVHVLYLSAAFMGQSDGWKQFVVYRGSVDENRISSMTPLKVVGIKTQSLVPPDKVVSAFKKGPGENVRGTVILSLLDGRAAKGEIVLELPMVMSSPDAGASFVISPMSSSGVKALDKQFQPKMMTSGKVVTMTPVQTSLLFA